MTIDESINTNGVTVATTLCITDSGAMISVDNNKPMTLPVRALLLVMRRFGRELDPTIAVDGEQLELGSGMSLCQLQFRAQVDVEPKSYLVLVGDGANKAALSNVVTSALLHLGNTISQGSPNA